MTTEKTKNDTRIKEMLSKIKVQIDEHLKNKPKTSYSTNGIFKDKSSIDAIININAITDIKIFISIVANLLEKNEYYKKSVELLAIKADDIKIDGYTVDEWISDIKQRIDTINWTAKRKQLQDAHEKLNCLISEEAKTSLELDSISAILNC